MSEKFEVNVRWLDGKKVGRVECRTVEATSVEAAAELFEVGCTWTMPDEGTFMIESIPLLKRLVPFGTPLVSRHVSREHGTEGPVHDPYSFETWSFEHNGREVSLRMGIGEKLYIEGEEVAFGPEAVKQFEELVGMSVQKFEKLYWRLHPYYPDPMGHPSQYI